MASSGKDVHLFSKRDIGAEILPILTTGLYRDTFDTVREYIQNSIDANADSIEVRVDPDILAVSDDGDGMDEEAARQAIRLGISEKNPLRDVGFRGIGIYSAFNLAQILSIYTKSKSSQKGYVLRFDFKKAREELDKEQVRRKKGLPPELYLETLLGGSVSVEPDTENVIQSHGTRAVMKGLLPHVYDRLTNWEAVTEYLQDVVPLPFHPDFKYATSIQRKFKEEDYRVVSALTLQIDGRKESLFRPYRNDMFSAGEGRPPKFFALAEGTEHFGFAWVCTNDRRKVLEDKSLRGLLIKKYGFSISTRSYLEPFFPRVVFNRRITGELIVQHKELIPNAARSDFENNAARQKFLESINRFIGQVSEWANMIQEEDKAIEVMEESLAELRGINKRLPEISRDKEQLLELNVRLANIDRQLKPHRRRLAVLDRSKTEYKDAAKLLEECMEFVHTALLETRRAQKKTENQIARSIQRELEAKATSKKHERQERLTLCGVLESAGLAVGSEAAPIIDQFESEYLMSNIDGETYQKLLREFYEFLHDSDF